jgi:Ca2+-transporting ATPase
MRDLFRFGPLHTDDIALTLAAGAVVLLVLEMLKRQWGTIAALPK